MELAPGQYISKNISQVPIICPIYNIPAYGTRFDGVPPPFVKNVNSSGLICIIFVLLLQDLYSVLRTIGEYSYCRSRHTTVDRRHDKLLYILLLPRLKYTALHYVLYNDDVVRYFKPRALYRITILYIFHSMYP